MSLRGTSELTRILRELFDRHNRTFKRSPHSTTVRIRDLPEQPPTADRVVMDDTQPSLTPKWGAVTTWSRVSNNVLWGEGAKWQ